MVMVIPNLLLVAGTGNKSGKTTFACCAIEQFRDYKIIGIKITPHFHETTPGLKIMVEKPGYSIYEETDPGTNKDSSRMLKAGASRVFYAKVTDKVLINVFSEIMKQVPAGTPVVCESPALRYFVVPGLFIIMKSENSPNNKNINKLLQFPHVMIHLKDLFSTGTLPISFEGRKWIYKE